MERTDVIAPTARRRALGPALCPGQSIQRMGVLTGSTSR